MIFWVVIPCSFGGGYECFEGTGSWKQEVERIKQLCKGGKDDMK